MANLPAKTHFLQFFNILQLKFIFIILYFNIKLLFNYCYFKIENKYY